MLKKEFEYYLKHQEDLVKKYNNKFLIIIGEEVVDSFDTEEEAFHAAKEKFELGTFLIQFCTPGDSSYTQTYHSRVSFSA
jgi:hypothetical protein